MKKDQEIMVWLGLNFREDDHIKNAFTGENLSDEELEIQSFFKELLNWRKIMMLFMMVN